MIDKIKIYLPATVFNGDLSCWKLLKQDKLYDHYCYCREDLLHPFPLKLKYHRTKKNISILGSLKKWYLGKYALTDFNQQTFYLALKTLSKSLNISLECICKGLVTQCEIGLNVRTKISPLNILPKIVAYKTFQRDNTYEKDGTIYFGTDNSSRKLIIYDKYKEICEHAKGNDLSRLQKVQDAFYKRGYYFLRMEVRMNDKKSFQELHYGHIRNLGDIYRYWNDLYSIWATVMADLIVYSGVKEDRKMTPEEYKTAAILNDKGFYQTMREIVSRCVSRTKNGRKTRISKERKHIVSVSRKYADRSSYNTYTLKADMAKSLLRKRKKDKLNLLFLYKTLWNVPVTSNNNREK